MKKKISLILILLIHPVFGQNIEKKEVIGTWELIETIDVNPTNNNIDIGELIIHDEKENADYDSIQKLIEKRKKEDPRITKWHYVFQEKYFLEYRFEYGGKFKSKIVNDIIYKFGKPFYRIKSVKNDTLKLEEYEEGTIKVLKKVHTDLSDFEILGEY
ncbi:hypothetical protein [Aquimarina litoralis]|uniref:hypothetical protein n=1 Tax=Aquimarina litoralis TaxID=584605 RepID=UPI001C58A6AE|nr:hypothetical protein [Aquimarina litoralis]MBW1296277.1 hypothetical protein [Aquimarina litoralis]